MGISVGVTVLSSVFLVALVVSAATTIGAAISTTGTLTVEDTSTLSHVLPSSNNAKDLGAFGTAWRQVYASGTVYAGQVIAQDYISVGSGASSTIRSGASATSTFSSGVEIKEASATSTLSIGNLTGAVNQGGCIVLGSGDGVNGALYVYVVNGDGGLYLATSTDRDDCF